LIQKGKCLKYTCVFPFERLFCLQKYLFTISTSGKQLRCARKTREYARNLLFIALNMLRAEVVEHPRQWPFTGFHEITAPPERYRHINRHKLLQLLDGTDETALARD